MSLVLASTAEPSGKLCEVCRRINFPRHKYDPFLLKVSLGTWRGLVQKTSCPFCRLVVRALNSKPLHSVPSLDDQIYLRSHSSWELGVEISPYDQLKSESYSNKFDLRSVAKRCKRLPQRLIVTGEDYVATFIQYLADPAVENSVQHFLGRRIDRDRVDIQLLRSWMKRCRKFHGDICNDDGIAGLRLPDNLRLIDVKARKLIRAPQNRCPPYLTLSYVWGVELMQKTDCEPAITNRKDLRYDEFDNECTPVPEKLPKTIDDAMWLTSELGYDYLWVDALCIIQDDPDEDKKLHLEKMDAVYNCSSLTIAAGSGLHANSGLPGIGASRSRPQHVESVKGVNLAAMAPSFSELENSRFLVWNTRGWTFQEKILAKRLMLFTDYQVYFRCSESIWTEEVFMETEEPSKSVEAREAKYRWAADRQSHIPSRKLYFVKTFVPQLNIDDEWNYLGKFPDYAAAIKEYSQRTLSNRKDTLIAVDGVLKTLRLDAGRFVKGVPEAHLLQSLLWHGEPGSVQTRIDLTFPSWSWAGWKIEKGMTWDVLDVRVLRIILITIRNIFMGCVHALQSLSDLSGSSTSDETPSSSTSSSSSSSPYSSSGSSGSSSSNTPSKPYMPARPKRDWTTLNAVGKATWNVAYCFALPLMFQHHTVRSAWLYDNGTTSQLVCESPLSIETLMKDEKVFDDRNSSDRGESNRYHRRKARALGITALSLRLVVVEYSIGKCLGKVPSDDDETGVFEILDKNKCVGEVWTTLRHAKQGYAEFLTISWGLSLQVAEIDRSWVPKWNFDAAILPSSKTNTLLKVCGLVQELLSWNSGKHLAGHYGQRKTEEQLSVTQFFHALLRARKGKPRPKFLWSTVNLLMVERDNNSIATRVGVGRVIFESWLLRSSMPQEVVLA